MKILVPAKRVMDYRARVRIDSVTCQVDTSHAKQSLNPFDEIALVRAVQLKQTFPNAEVIVVSIGHDQDILRHALAMGADRALFVETEQTLMPLQIAHLLKQIVQQEKIDLVLMGKQATDSDNNQTGQMLAGLLDWPQATCAKTIDYQDRKLVVEREVDAGIETVAMRLPAVITADLRLAQPAPPSLPAIMLARSKPIVTISLEDFTLPVSNTLEVLHVSLPTPRQAGKRLSSVSELVGTLRKTSECLA